MPQSAQNWRRIQALASRMDWFRGLRAGVALCAPLLLGNITGMQNLGWASLGGFEGIIADTGGPYRSRMASIATLSIGGALGLFLGSICGSQLIWALPVTLLFCFFWSYMAVLGPPFSSAGILVQVMFICGIGAPTATWHQALTHALLLLAGGAWAALLSLFLWPLDAYRPARAAVSDCYRELASFMASVSELSNRQQQRASLWRRLAQHHHYRIRRAVENGWQAVAAIRAEHQVETAQGYHLVVLLEIADMLIARTVALAEHLESLAGVDSCGCMDRNLAGLEDLRAAELWIAELLLRKRGQTVAIARAMRLSMQQLPDRLESCKGQDDPTARFLLAQISEAAAQLETSIESVTLLRLGKISSSKFRQSPEASTGHFAHVYLRMEELRQGLDLGRLVANFNPSSLGLRHAARVALVCGLDVALILLLHIDHGYWLLMTSVIVLQPHVSGTLRRSSERIGGTVAGGILAALLAYAIHAPIAITAALFPLALLCLAILPVNYAAFSFFLTPTFVLAWLPYSGDWQLALVRIINTIAGALISLLAMTFLFPAWEKDRAPRYLHASIAANHKYLTELIASWRGGARSSRILANARRAAALAHNDTEESLERLLAENWSHRRPFALFVVAFVTYLRRFAQSVTTLASLDGELGWKQSESVQNRLMLLDRRMQWLAENTNNPTPSSWPEAGTEEFRPPDMQHPGENQLQRLERQTEVLHRQLNSLRQHGWLSGS